MSVNKVGVEFTAIRTDVPMQAQNYKTTKSKTYNLKIDSACAATNFVVYVLEIMIL